VQLPSEAEWEKAARGGREIPSDIHPVTISECLTVQGECAVQPNGQPKRRYPWGDEPDPGRANYRDTGLHGTSAAGCFPGGASPYGCLDMAGNVWEWTRSLWGKDWRESEYGYPYPYDPRDGREDLEAGNDVRRVLRGGSFINVGGVVRCASRYGNSPDARYEDGGFRVVVVRIASDLWLQRS
jgi:formylglycine-generating enzyme required for sulfatase activity